MAGASRYDRIIEAIFFANRKKKASRVEFGREECVQASEKLGIPRIKNLGDIMYSYRFRRDLPQSIRDTAPRGCEWIILGTGVAHYEFRLAKKAKIEPAANRKCVKIPDATPEIVKMYMPSRDEQALLTRVRYNRVIDLFTGLTCYSVQNHLRTSVEDVGQIEVDEIYFGVSRSGAHFVLPCQAKSPGDKFGLAQVLQDMKLCAERYPIAICRPIAMQFRDEESFALLELDVEEKGDKLALVVVDERHFRFVRKEDISDDELQKYVRSEQDSHGSRFA